MIDRSNIIKEAIEYRKQLEKENAELKAENETLKSQLDFEVQKKEVLEAKNERLTSCLQEIKELAKKECKDCSNKRTDSCWICTYYPILNLITKAESEEE